MQSELRPDVFAEAASDVPPLLSLTGVTKTFPGVRALSDVSLKLYPGKVFVTPASDSRGDTSKAASADTSGLNSNCMGTVQFLEYEVDPARVRARAGTG